MENYHFWLADYVKKEQVFKRKYVLNATVETYAINYNFDYKRLSNRQEDGGVLSVKIADVLGVFLHNVLLDLQLDI